MVIAVSYRKIAERDGAPGQRSILFGCGDLEYVIIVIGSIQIICISLSLILQAEVDHPLGQAARDFISFKVDPLFGDLYADIFKRIGDRCRAAVRIEVPVGIGNIKVGQEVFAHIVLVLDAFHIKFNHMVNAVLRQVIERCHPVVCFIEILILIEDIVPRFCFAIYCYVGSLLALQRFGIDSELDLGTLSGNVLRQIPDLFDCKLRRLRAVCDRNAIVHHISIDDVVAFNFFLSYRIFIFIGFAIFVDEVLRQILNGNACPIIPVIIILIGDGVIVTGTGIEALVNYIFSVLCLPVQPELHGVDPFRPVVLLPGIIAGNILLPFLCNGELNRVELVFNVGVAGLFQQVDGAGSARFSRSPVAVGEVEQNFLLDPFFKGRQHIPCRRMRFNERIERVLLIFFSAVAVASEFDLDMAFAVSGIGCEGIFGQCLCPGEDVPLIDGELCAGQLYAGVAHFHLGDGKGILHIVADAEQLIGCIIFKVIAAAKACRTVGSHCKQDTFSGQVFIAFRGLGLNEPIVSFFKSHDGNAGLGIAVVDNDLTAGLVI